MGVFASFIAGQIINQPDTEAKKDKYQAYFVRTRLYREEQSEVDKLLTDAGSPPTGWGDIALAQLQKLRIAESKQKLATYLADNPMPSNVHGGKEQLYNVTADKQALLTSELLMAQGAATMSLPYQPTWNAVGQPCEPWSLEELSQLAMQIAAYVKPLVAHQQHLEVEILACKTVAQLNAIVISYDLEVAA